MRIKYLLTALSFMSASVSANYGIEYINKENNLRIHYNQADPFDENKKEYYKFVFGWSKYNHFEFRCNIMKFGTVEGSYYHDGRYDAEIAIKIDDNEPHMLSGRHIDSGFDSLYYVDLNDAMVKQMKSGKTLHASGKLSYGGWESLKVDLSGFSQAYDKLCSQ